MEKFDTIIIDSTTTLRKEGMEISAFIAGVNSGAYGLPYVIKVRVWAKKWFFRKFFHNEMHLNIHQVRMLRDECEKVLEFANKSNPNQ